MERVKARSIHRRLTIILQVILVIGLVWFRRPGQETTMARCAWAMALAVGALMVLAALRLTEL